MTFARRLAIPSLAIALCACGPATNVSTDYRWGADDLSGGGVTDQGAPGDGSACADEDHDEYGTGCAAGPDCDDTSAESHPGAPEICDDTKDNNCNGQVDEQGCVCAVGNTRECYDGPGGSDGNGPCHKGFQKCAQDGTWGACTDQVVPQKELCDGVDGDCNGKVDDGVLNLCGACGAVPAEQCGDGIDNDCSGAVDESCGTCDPQCLCMGGNCTCMPPTNQPCYTGAPQTAGVGVCKAGTMDCLNMNGVWKWGACNAQVLPGPLVCDGGDHDCNGAPDDGPGCACTEGAKRSCGSAVGQCKKGTQTCANGQWGLCLGGIGPQPEMCDALDNNCNSVVDEGVRNACGSCGPAPLEMCGDGLDGNCNGVVDEKCDCGGKDSQACYSGPVETRQKGACKDGLQACMKQEVGEEWGPCQNQVLPAAEVCGDQLDNDCDGEVDDGCGCKDGAQRPCGSMVGECKPGTQTCAKGAWGACMGGVAPQAETCDTKDNNCNGLADEGVLNACGKCAPMPCFVKDYNKPGQCNAADRTCSGVVPDPMNPDAITLGETLGGVFPFIYISVTNKNEVALLNTDTGQKMWQKPSHGVLPSRTAVALDGTVWVGNRCLQGGQENNFACSSVAHLDLNGNLICRGDIPGYVRGVAIDADGNIWAGTYNGQTAWKLSGTDKDNQNPPRCKILGSVNVGVPIYGLAVDGRGYLWTATSPTKKIDVKTIKLVDTVNHGNFYGVAIDKQNRVWFGNDGIHRIDGDPPYAVLNTGITGAYYAIMVHSDGTIWAAQYGGTGGVVKITLNANGTAVQNIQYFKDPENQGNHGIAVDKLGKVWSPQISAGYVNRWTTGGVREQRYAVDPGNTLYTYSDMTGIQLRTITTRDGTWVQNFDSGYQKPVWDHIEWASKVPVGTSVQVRARASDDQAGFSNGGATQWCGPFPNSPAALANCAFLHNHRWAQVEVKLATTMDGVKPVVSGVKVFWSY
ncbi:MAG: hypothetical protein EXR72_18425 [Myxococcales bacterium]|nr:hypothetical protein [Myxococcales bacterium]